MKEREEKCGCSWFAFMLSIPLTKPMTRTEIFTQWSSLLAYCLGGLTFLIFPNLWKFMLQLEFQGHTEGYLRLVGLGVLVIGFILIISARSDHKAPGHGAILGSVLSRLICVNGILLMLLLRDMIPLSFAILFMGLDSFLLLITLFIWRRETEGASVKSFFCEVFLPICQFPILKVRSTLAFLYLVGIFQIWAFLIFVIVPDIAQSILQLDSFQSYADGFLASAFFTLSIHGMYLVTNASAVNHSIVPASLFYRILLNAPVLLMLFLMGQIERNLSLFLSGFDMLTCFILLLLIVFEKRRNSTKDSDEYAMLTPDENELNR